VLESLLARYGLLAVFGGAFLEGETVLVLAGFTAHRGYLGLPSVMLAAYAGTLLGDQLWFWLGRIRGRSFLEAHPSWSQRVAGARSWIDAHERTVIWSYRFLYGIRTVTPFVLGMGGMSPVRFALFNSASAAVWVAVISGAGYLLGSVLEQLLGDLRAIESLVFVAILVAGALAWIRHAARARRRRREAE